MSVALLAVIVVALLGALGLAVVACMLLSIFLAKQQFPELKTSRTRRRSLHSSTGELTLAYVLFVLLPFCVYDALKRKVREELSPHEVEEIEDEGAEAHFAGRIGEIEDTTAVA